LFELWRKEIMKKILYALVIASIIILPGLSFADDKEEDKKDKENPKRMEEVVVTGTRFEEEVKKVPANVSVINEEDIINSNAQNIVDILKTEEGISVRDKLGNGKGAEVDLRGFGEAASYNVLVLVDGRRVNEIDLSGVDWSQLPVEIIDRIEIIRGTGSVLYGDNAVGGVINIITKIPSEKFQGSVDLIAGSYGRNKERASISGGYKDVTANLFASYDATNGYRPENGLIAKNVGGRVVYNPSETLSIDFSGSYHADDFDLPGHLTEAQYLADRTMTAFPLDEGSSEDYYLKTGIDLYLEGIGNIVGDIAYRKRDNEAIFPDPSGVFPQATKYKNETISITPRYINDMSIMDHTNTLITGADLYWTEQRGDSFGGYYIPTTNLTGFANTDRDSFGIYISDEFSILKNLILTTGVRYERVKYTFDQEDLSMGLGPLNTNVKKDESVYNLGLSYLYNEKSSVFVRTNRSVRFPLTDEVSYIDWSTFIISANTNLKPQLGIHYEAGVNHFFNDKISGSFTLFRAELENEIFYNPLTYSNENHPETLHEGFEAGIKGEFFGWLTLYGNYTYVEAEFKKNPYKNNSVPAVPNNRMNFGLCIKNLIDGMVLTADYNYTGSKYAISDQANAFGEVDSYYTLNSKVSYQWKSVNAFFGVNNITNQEYSAYEVMDTFLTTRNFYPAPKRNWTAGLNMKF
jgi:iron complex outermembrane recepter protein